MKRLNNIFHKIISIDNLIAADRVARKGKLNNKQVVSHLESEENNILKLHHSLLDKTFTTSDYKVFKVYDPKERVIHSLPYYPDRIVHHAVMNVLEPYFIKWFTTDTYSSIKGRGLHLAAGRLKNALKIDKPGTQYCLKMDIQKFYPSIHNDTLKHQLERKIKCKNTLWLLFNIIDSIPGLPIGNYTSQYFANFYLTGFDRWIKEVQKVKYYFRYADDIVILSASKEKLHELRDKISTYLYGVLSLKVKSNYQVFPVKSRGIDFLGYVFFHSHTHLRKRIKQRFIKMVKFNRNDKSVASYNGWLKHCDSFNLKKKYLAV